MPEDARGDVGAGACLRPETLPLDVPKPAHPFASRATGSTGQPWTLAASVSLAAWGLTVPAIAAFAVLYARRASAASRRPRTTLAPKQHQGRDRVSSRAPSTPSSHGAQLHDVGIMI